MAPTKLFRLLTLVSLTFISSAVCSDDDQLSKQVINSPAQGIGSSFHHVFGSGHTFGLRRGHNSISKRKRSEGQRCRERPVENIQEASTPTTDSVAQPPAPDAPPPADQGNNNHDGNNANSSGGSSGSSSGSSGAPFKGKVCLPWPNGDDASLVNFQTDHSGMIYTWSPEIPSNTYGYTGVPQLWGKNQVDEFQRLVKPGYASYVLGFNEPDMESQSHLSSQEAASLWKQYIQPLASQGYKLVSPATTSNPASKQWMKDFFAACDGCTFDAVAVHYYDTTADGLIAYLEDYHNTFGKPIWLTEFACQNFNAGAQCSMDQIKAFMGQFVSWAKDTDWLEQYCWFGAMHDMVNVNPFNQLMQVDGQVMDLGHQYLAG